MKHKTCRTALRGLRKLVHQLRRKLTFRRVHELTHKVSCPVSKAAMVAMLLGFVAIGMLSGCSSQAPTTENGLTHIRVVLDYAPNTNHTGIYVAQALGYYKDAGLDVEIIYPPEDGSDALVGAGGAEFGVSTQDAMANYLGSDDPLPVEAIAAIIQHNTSGIMSRKADGITSPKKMEGHTYATWGLAVEQATIKSVVTADGGDFSKLKLVPYATDDDVAGLRANAYDAVWVFEGWAPQEAKLQDVAVNYFSFISIDKVFDFYTPVLVANIDYAQANPDVAKAFVAVTKKGYEYAIAHPDKAADILCKAVPELDPQLVKVSQEFLSPLYQDDASEWGVIDVKRWNAYHQWLNDQKLVEVPIQDNVGFTNEYLN